MDWRRVWPWAAWAAAGVVLEAVALGTGRIDPLTRVLRAIRRYEVGRLIYEMGDWHFRQ